MCKEFIFSGEEQRFWYEELYFYVKSVPKACNACRKEIRDAKALNQELSELLHDGEPGEQDKLLRIADIYRALGKEEKMKYFQARAKQGS